MCDSITLFRPWRLRVMSKDLHMRALNDSFLNAFLEDGKLFPLLDLVRKDHTLCMELRGEYVEIYYRGGLLYKIDDNEYGNYKIYYNENYKILNKQNKNYKLKEVNSVSDAVKEVPIHKQDMDIYFSQNNKLEREYQQLIERENNYSGDVSHNTDYFILDIEYAFSDKKNDSSDEAKDETKEKTDELNARYDMLAVKWISTNSNRKKVFELPIAFIEVKYGDGAVSGNASISKHIRDYINFRHDSCKMKQLAKDMEAVFGQKHKLHLITSYENKELKITINPEEVEYIFVFANHNPDSSKLIAEITTAIKTWKGKPEAKYLNEIKVAKSSDMGYGLFAFKNGKECLYPTIEEFVKAEGK